MGMGMGPYHPNIGVDHQNLDEMKPKDANSTNDQSKSIQGGDPSVASEYPNPNNNPKLLNVFSSCGLLNIPLSCLATGYTLNGWLYLSSAQESPPRLVGGAPVWHSPKPQTWPILHTRQSPQKMAGQKV